MDYKNEFEGIIEAVKSEMRAQKSALQNEENSVRDAEGFEKAQSTAPKESDGAAAGASQDGQSFVLQEEGLLRGDSLNGGQNSGSQAAHLRAVSDKILSTALDDHLCAADGGADDGRLRDGEGEATGGNFKISADAADEIYDRLGSEIDAQDFVHDLPLNFIKSSPSDFAFDSEQEEISAQNFAGFKELGESGYESFDDDFKEFGEMRSPKNHNAQDFKFSAPDTFPSARDSASAQNFSTAKNATDDSKTENEISSEAEFLNALKERILVLFEGLNAFDQGDIEARVELNLKFMEFLLASIDDRLEHLSKR